MAVIKPITDHGEIRRWAESHSAVPVEVMPLIVDGEPAILRIMLKAQVEDHANVRVIELGEFFLKFDAMGLSFVYDDDLGLNQILQQEELSPYRHPDHRWAARQH